MGLGVRGTNSNLVEGESQLDTRYERFKGELVEVEANSLEAWANRLPLLDTDRVEGF